MTSAVKTPYSSEQITVWLRGLLTIAWADGNFDAQEQELINSITKDELAPCLNWDSLEIITPEELAAVLGKGTAVGENFLRTAVMVAIADGIYSPSEEKILHKFCQALELDTQALTALRHTLEYPKQVQETTLHPPDILHPLRDWLDGLEIHDPRVARFLCKMIPSQCPFERDVTLFGKKIVHIPPMCKINPLYEQLVGLRFRALSYLADECQEDVSQYI
ncbi:Mo-dependent nitrogenase C-terminal domain-containing protein [Sphaerospermopsis kisseleviana CS-549]|uniref:Mo-dependent nitrogenase C-terminal domain-containing protein n=1 Tax=Sphaerospermopsis kisseleviana CS-549 TaxID=3021783 RepID=A0ABT4ZKQ2_9CYAN|nr:Mo-dependent nitrogenase C-terminal domain-containing protein [Sphaerospermopsis kisseleviana]MDB9439826.1 Mo-dependent nitrogenase C-terminal domain-containing protein [Sphaerospermopsis kisseleviana CS-549]BAZ83052.1 Mo-dependent nitrogenase family protein [Sphaerospermopsis kisseleviana NIES-73]